MLSINHAWQLLSEGNQDRAEQIFQRHVSRQPENIDALCGLARVALHRSELARAEELARQAGQIDDTADIQLLLGEILGAQGKRKRAEHHLAHALKFHSSDSYGRALLGEQKIRQGRWDEGADDFIEALSSDPDGDAFRLFKRVSVDLIDAYNAGKLPESRAQRFINQIDYSVPKTGPDMQSFFGEARRAITAGQPLAHQRPRPEQLLPKSVRQAAKRQPAAPPSSQGPAPRRPQQPAADQTRSTNPPATPPPGSSPSQTSPGGSSQAVGVDANQKDLHEVIQRERSLNRNLVADLAEMPPPDWPSEGATNPIDTIESMALESHGLIGESTSIDTRDSRITSGDLLAEIFLERCLRNLLVATQKNKATTIVMRPESISQMELNCRDGLLDELKPLSPIYSERPNSADFRQVAMAGYIGQCLFKAYDGTWTFATPVRDSYLEVGTMILEPFDLVERWMAADDKDEVCLQRMIRQAEHANKQSTSMAISPAYIDPTRELEKSAMGAKLAELWALYRFELSDSAFSKIAETIEVRSISDAVTVFTIGAQWVPDFASGPDDAALTDNGGAAVAYLRHTGEFLPLASRKSLGRVVESRYSQLDQQSATQAIQLLAKFHRPGWWIAATASEASELSQRVGRELQPPQLTQNKATTTLQVDGLSAQEPVRWNLIHDANSLVPWRLSRVQ